MQHEGSNPMGSLRRRLTEVIVAGLTGVTAAVITSRYGWPGAITGAAFVPMFTTIISAIYTGYLDRATGYLDRAAKMVLTAARPAPPPLGPLTDRPPPPPLGPLTDRPPPPPFGPTSRAPRLPKLSQVSAALRWFSLQVSPERRRSILNTGLRFGVVAAIVGLGIVTAVEIQLGGNLSCVIWDTDCSPGGINPPPPSIVSAINSICQG
jgi:hypothetical protein